MGFHHTDDAVCPLCSDKLRVAHPFLQAWFKTLKQAFPRIHISWSYRNEQEQEQAFSDGKTKAHFGQSPHNKMPSEALDLFVITENHEAQWPPQIFREIDAYNQANGFKLTWGGSFKRINDADHFQITEAQKA